MTESILQYVLDELQAHKGHWPEVAEKSGVKLTTLRKIVYRTSENPGVLYIERLANYFRSRESA